MSGTSAPQRPGQGAHGPRDVRYHHEVRTTLPPCRLPYLLTGFGVLELRQKVRKLAQRGGLGRPTRIPLEDLEPPDSRLVDHARALAREAYDAHFLGHGERTAALGRAAGRHLGLAPDPEALYVAALLHDLGLTQRFAGPGPFELRGADAAHALCVGHGSPHADVVHEAIALHTSLAAALGPAEIRLVQSGSGGDLVGLDHELVHLDTRRAIDARWPKAAGYAAHVVDALRRETAPFPESPGAGLLRVGFGGRVHAWHR